MNNVRYCSIVPLIGGMILGAMEATKTLPEYILSYAPFYGNDKIFLDYKPTIPYHIIENDNTITKKIDRVDFVSALCPCAGLSQLNSAASRGPNAPQNDWLYKSAEFVFENIKPRVFWGENAPALYSSVGLPVAEKLKNIGNDYGYSMTLLRTDSTFHGIPQKRQRTFYFFWDSKYAPILSFYNTPYVSIKEHLRNVINDDEDLQLKKQQLLNDPLYIFLKQKYKENWRNVVKQCAKSLMDVVLMLGDIDEFLQFTQKYSSEESYNRALHAKNKRDIGKNFWDFSPFLPIDHMGALTGARMNAIHPEEDRLMTYRELAHMMGIPQDMKIPYDAPGKIFQNVPSWTARDWTFEVVKFLNGELKFSDQSFLKQNNCTRMIENETYSSAQQLF